MDYYENLLNKRDQVTEIVIYIALLALTILFFSANSRVLAFVSLIFFFTAFIIVHPISLKSRIVETDTNSLRCAKCKDVINLKDLDVFKSKDGSMFLLHSKCLDQCRLMTKGKNINIKSLLT